MKKYVYCFETKDEIERTLSDITILLYLSELHRDCSEMLKIDSLEPCKDDVSGYLSDRLFELLGDFNSLVSECDIMEV